MAAVFDTQHILVVPKANMCDTRMNVPFHRMLSATSGPKLVVKSVFATTLMTLVVGGRRPTWKACSLWILPVYLWTPPVYAVPCVWLLHIVSY